MPTIPTSTLQYVHLASRADSSPSPECTTAVPGRYGHVDDYSACNAYYTYNPSFATAILFTVLFGFLTIAHVSQAFWHKKRFTWVVIVGVLFELTSFVCRTLGSRDQQNIGLATASQLLFLLAPLWINAFVYMTFGRLVHFFHPDRRCAGLKAPSIAKYFVWADIVSFLVQAAGGMMLNPDSDADARKIGLKVYMAGVGVQEGFIVVFTILGIKFVRDMNQIEQQGQVPENRTGWRLQMWSMFIVLILITVRIIFRLVEFTKGFEPGNPMLFNEAFVYALDATPMLLALLLLGVMHPGRVLAGPDSEFPRLSRKEKKVLKQERKSLKQGKKERRHCSKKQGYAGVEAGLS
ncbi:hypothetical protein BU25DRAFT_212258 [Macroventuria anomochaeta]|uniref:Uncharacterized protein n=1 Tax=Macroventuria anomochaeta TaxID=301207 RepID=A0ACB6RMS6_9PLEO|nr:uncharacterized protein BU25DRAFT_212258 [Macroventuria anomochaeta]KAF2622403.1 hypothetical protein BU25DRAFT_212258 [Macroventuria anomochaeta]